MSVVDALRVTQPRMRLAGTTYFVTHTVHDRRFLLTPSPDVNRIVQYCAARAAKVLDVELHWLSVQSNHIHLGVTDLGTDLSRFMQAMDRAIARCLIEHYRQTHPHPHLDAVWTRRSFSEVALLTPKPMLRDQPLPQLIEGIELIVRDKQQALRDEQAASRRGFRGVKAVLNADPFDSPTSVRPKGGRNPTVAAGGDREMLLQGIALVRAFRERYRQAWKDYRAGAREAVFPPGTLNMRLLHDRI